MSWCVPFEVGALGARAVLWSRPVSREIVILLERTNAGWIVPAARRYVSLPHQLYLDQLAPLVADGRVRELAAVGLRSGQWMTLWCRDAGEAGFRPQPGGWWLYFGRHYRVLWSGSNVDEANAYMQANPGSGVLVSESTWIVVVSLDDLGLPTLPARFD